MTALALASLAWPARADQVIFDDELAHGWEDCSWDAAVDFSASA